MKDLDELVRLAREAPRDALPGLLGRVVEAEAVCRLRLAEVPAAPTAASRVIDAAEAAVIANTTPRWLAAHTKGMRFRCDLSRKQVRYDESGLRGWLVTRRRP